MQKKYFQELSFIIKTMADKYIHFYQYSQIYIHKLGQKLEINDLYHLILD